MCIRSLLAGKSPRNNHKLCQVVYALTLSESMAYTMTSLNNQDWITQASDRSFSIDVNEQPDRMGDWVLYLQVTSPDCPADPNSLVLAVPIKVLCSNPTILLDPWAT